MLFVPSNMEIAMYIFKLGFVYALFRRWDVSDLRKEGKIIEVDVIKKITFASIKKMF